MHVEIKMFLHYTTELRNTGRFCGSFEDTVGGSRMDQTFKSELPLVGLE